MKVLEEPIIYDDFNGRIKADQTAIGSLTTNCGNDAPRNGVKIIEPIIIDDTYGFEEKARIYEDCPTIRADRQGLKVAEPISTRGSDIVSTLRASMHKQGERNLLENLKNGRGYEGVVEPTIWGSLQEHCAVKKDGVCPTLTQAMGAGGGQIPMHNYDYRVRKLTEKECGRLMAVKDEDYSKMRKNQSKSAMYHCFGDSICCNVLMALFGEMLEVNWKSKVEDLVEELQDKE